MGEKEIKPADDKPKPGPLDPGGDLTTRERPGTGNPNAKPEQPTGGGGGGHQGGGEGRSGGGTYTGSVDYGDGYTMGRNEAGETYLNHPDGSTATWDADNQTWQDKGGKTMGGGWSGGHRPTDFGPKR